MLRLLSLMLALVLAGCATTGMYSTPKGEGLVTLTAENQLSSNSQEDTGGWQMPGQSTPARAAIFKVDGDRLAEQAGEAQATLTPGLHKIEVFADQGGILRFGQFHYEFEEEADYQVRIKAADGGGDYQVELIKAASPSVPLLIKVF